MRHVCMRVNKLVYERECANGRYKEREKERGDKMRRKVGREGGGEKEKRKGGSTVKRQPRALCTVRAHLDCWCAAHLFFLFYIIKLEVCIVHGSLESCLSFIRADW